MMFLFLYFMLKIESFYRQMKNELHCLVQFETKMKHCKFIKFGTKHLRTTDILLADPASELIVYE